MRRGRLFIYGNGKNGESFEFSSHLSIGRATGNSVCLNETCLSRHHAVIEQCGQDYRVVDLDSSNGTFVNGRQIPSMKDLRDGDELLFGGSIRGRFSIPDDVAESDQAPNQPLHHQSQSSEPNPPQVHLSQSPSSNIQKFLAILLGLAVTGSCSIILKPVVDKIVAQEPCVKLVSPLTGSWLKEITSLEVEISSRDQVNRVVYELDGEVIATNALFPFNATIDPNHLPDHFAARDGGVYLLTAKVEFLNGHRAVKSPGILIRFGTRQPVRPGESNSSFMGNSNQISGPHLVRIHAQELAGQLSGRSNYSFSPEFSELIESQIKEYLQNPSQTSQNVNREMIKTFRDRGVPPLMGLILAICLRNSSSSAQGGLGAWKLPPEIARQYLKEHENLEVVEDPKRSLEIVADYLHDLLVIFEPEDFMYALACFGKPLKDAGRIRMTLETNDPDRKARPDVWSFVRQGVFTKADALGLAQFFAVGILAEYPQDFGKHEGSLSTLL